MPARCGFRGPPLRPLYVTTGRAMCVSDAAWRAFRTDLARSCWFVARSGNRFRPRTDYSALAGSWSADLLERNPGSRVMYLDGGNCIERCNAQQTDQVEIGERYGRPLSRHRCYRRKRLGRDGPSCRVYGRWPVLIPLATGQTLTASRLSSHWRGSRLFPFLSLSDSKAQKSSFDGFPFGGEIFK